MFIHQFITSILFIFIPDLIQVSVYSLGFSVFPVVCFRGLCPCRFWGGLGHERVLKVRVVGRLEPEPEVWKVFERF